MAIFAECETHAGLFLIGGPVRARLRSPSLWPAYKDRGKRKASQAFERYILIHDPSRRGPLHRSWKMVAFKAAARGGQIGNAAIWISSLGNSARRAYVLI